MNRIKRMAVQGKWENTELLSSSDEDLKIYCQPCDRDGPRMPAFGFCTDCREHLCETCFNLHKRHTLSRDHILLEKINMPQTFISATGSQAETLTTSCSHHQKEMIKFFCHDHKALLCHVCITMDHPRTSCIVNYIPEISASIIDSKEYQDILKAIEDVSKDFDSKFEYLKKLIEKSDKSLTDAMADLRKFRNEINERLDKLESETETIAKAIQQENSLNLEKFKTKCEEVTKSLTPWLDTIPHLNKQRQADRLFMQIKLAEQMIQDYKETILQIAANDVKQYKFQPNKDLKSLLHEEKFLGSWETKQVRPQRPSKAPCRAKSRKSANVGEICVKTSKDQSICFVTGMALLTPDLLVIVDQGNNAIKMVDITKKSVIDEIHLDETPTDITSVSKHELVVTLSSALLFLSASSKKLNKGHTLNLHGHCTVSVSCYQDKMVVSFSSPAKVQILDTSGIILGTVQDETIFKESGYVTTCESCIYVSDISINTVTKLDWQGNVMCKYVSKGEARGITMSNGENFFVCDWRNNMIKEVSGDCSEEKVVVKTNREPYAVCWCNETSMMYISSCSLPNNNKDNFLQVFKLS